MFLLIISMMNLDRYFAFAFAMRYFSFTTKKFITFWLGFLPFFLTYGMLFNYHANSVPTCEVTVNFLKSDVNTTFK